MSLPSFRRREAAPPARIAIRRRLLGRGSRLRTAGLAAGLLSLGLASVQPAHAATKTWDGSIADWYSDPTHWSPSGFPAAGDDAQNLFTNAAMTLGQSTTINSFFSNSAFTLNGGTFSGNKANAASTLQVNNIFTLNGGQINNFTLNAGTQQVGQPAPSVIFTTNGGNSLNNTIVNANLDLATNSNAYVQLFNTNTVNGAISLGAGGGNGVHLYNNASSLVIGSKGSLTGFGSVTQDNGGATVTNNGLFNANSAAGSALTLGVSTFSNTGTLEATNGGLLNLSNTFTNSSGAVKALGAGSAVTLTNGTTFTGSGSTSSGNLFTASGGGKVVVDGSALLGTINTAVGTALIFTTNGGNLLDNTTVNGNLDLATNSNAYLRLFDTDTVNGAISLGEGGSGNGLHLYNNASNLAIGSTGSLTGFGYVIEDNGGSTVANNGTLNANSTGNTLVTGVTNLNNNVGATLEATGGGALNLSNTTTTNYGAVAATGGGVINLTPGTTFIGNAGSTINTVGGTFNVLGSTLLGTLNGVGASSLVFNTDGGNNFNNTTANINLDLATNSNAYLRLFNAATVNGNIALGAAASGNGLHLYNNASSLVINGALSGFGYVIEDNGGSTVANNGTLNANSTGNTLVTSVSNLNNNVGATLEATGGGALNLSNTTTTNYGAVAATGGGVINLTPGTTFIGNAGSTINTVGGTFNVLGSTLLGTLNGVGASSLVFNTDGGNNFNNTTANINLDLATNSNAYLRLFNTDTINGAISLGEGGSGNGLHLYNSASSLVVNGTLSGFGYVIQDNGGATVTNNSTINANNVAGLTLGVTNFNNSAAATTEATNGGLLNLSNTFTNNSGAVKALGAGSAVTLTNGTTFTGSGSTSSGNLFTASGGGKVVVDGSALLGTINTAASTALIFTTNGGNLLDNTTVNGNLDLATNSNAYLRLFDTDTVNGAISLGEGGSGNGLHLYNSASNLVVNGTLSGFGYVIQDNGGATVTNNGTLNANSSGNTLVTGVTNFNNNVGATLEATNGGLLNLSNTFTNNSSAVKAVGAGSAVTLTSGTTFTGTGTAAQGNLITASGGGKVVVDGVSLLGTLNTAASTALIFTTNGGNLLDNTTVNGNLDLATNSNAYLRLFDTDTVNGNIALGAGGGNGIHLYNSASNLAIGSTGSLTGFGGVTQDNGGATVTNNGTINANTSGQTLTVSVDNFNNAATGTTNVANGATLTVNSGNATNSGAISVIQGGTANFSNGLTQSAGSTNVFGTLNASEALNGGVLAGFGKVVGNVTNTGGIVQSTTATGLVIQGNFTQTSGGELDAFFGNNFHDLLTVTGQTTLAGTLGVFDLDQAQPAGMAAAGSQFSFLNYSSGTLVATGTLGGFTQYFSNEIPLDNNTGIILGQNGFSYQLINNTANKSLDLKVVTAGSPVPEASTTVSLGLLLALGMGGMVIAAKRRKSA